MIRPDFQRATVISFVAHMLFFLTALAIMGVRSPYKGKVYTISLVSPQRAGPPAASKQGRRTPPPKKARKAGKDSQATRTPPEKKPAMALKKEDPDASRDNAQEAIEKLRREQKARDAEARKQESIKELKEKKRLEELRNRLAAEGASDAESRLSEGERNSALSAYSDKIMKSVKDNWLFPDVGVGTRTEVSITVFADGTIRINRIITPSGNRAFDQSVVKAIIKTGNVAPPPFGRNEDVTLNFIPVSR
jgi:colicin import membrane protein